MNELTAHTEGENEKVKRECKESTNSVMHEMIIHKLRQNIETLQENVIREIDGKMDVFAVELINELNRFDIQNNEVTLLFKEQNGKQYNSVNRLPKKDGSHKLPEKEFAARNSLLNDLFEIKHIRTIYHIFIANFFILWLNALTHDYVADGTINLGLGLIKIGFGKFHLACLIWCVLQAVSCLIYLGFKMWAKCLKFITADETRTGLTITINYFALGIFVIVQMGLIYGTVKLVLWFDLPPASSITILMEMIRFLMKNHAFVRSNAPRVFTGVEKDGGHKDIVPSFEKYIYFMFAPTLIYRDHYPRTKSIRWNRVLFNLLEVIAVIFYVSFIFERFLLPYFRHFGTASIQPQYIILSTFGCMMPGTIAYLCGFYCLLHAWMNATGEMLRFADRMFYTDWWNSASFDVYFRTWNIVVHDWLYTYVYKDMYEIVGKNSKVFCALIVFTISALFHELILAVSFRFFYPVLFILFQGCGFQLLFIRNKKENSFGNIFLWMAMPIGNGICISLYCMEYFARQNCPMSHTSLWEYYVPISWTCNGIDGSTGNYTESLGNLTKVEL